MIVGFEGSAEQVAPRREAVTALLTSLGGSPAGEEPGRAWEHGRFRAPYLRDSMLDLGVLVETIETATFWSRVEDLYVAVKATLQEYLGERALVLCHVSHVYETGCSLYFTVAARLGDEPLEPWLRAKRAASEAIVAHGATISHHHAVGTDHLPWLEGEIGPVGVTDPACGQGRARPDGSPQPRCADSLVPSSPERVAATSPDGLRGSAE